MKFLILILLSILVLIRCSENDLNKSNPVKASPSDTVKNNSLIKPDKVEFNNDYLEIETRYIDACDSITINNKNFFIDSIYIDEIPNTVLTTMFVSQEILFSPEQNVILGKFKPVLIMNGKKYEVGRLFPDLNSLNIGFSKVSRVKISEDNFIYIFSLFCLTGNETHPNVYSLIYSSENDKIRILN